MEAHPVAYPPDWDDDERMAFLFSAFKQNREVNSSDWDSKINFWAPLILKHAKLQGRPCFTLRQLQADFTRKGSVPLGMRTVIQEMIRQGALQRVPDFVAGVTNGWLAWGMRQLVIKPLHWTIGAVLGHHISADEVFVVPEVIKEQAAFVLQKYQSSHLRDDLLLCEKEIQSFCSKLCLDSSALNLILLQLQRDKSISMQERAGKKLVKFLQSGDGYVTPISESDLSIYDLQQSEKLLSERLQIMCKESDRLKEEAIGCKKKGNMQQALRCLRQRKLAEHRISDLQSKLDNVHIILQSISAAETDCKVISAYQTGLSALRLALKDVNLEKAEGLVDTIQEYCDLQDDYSQTLCGPATNNTDSEELERELDEILQSETLEVQINLPDVPRGPVVSLPQLPIQECKDRAGFPQTQHSLLDRKPVLHPMFQ